MRQQCRLLGVNRSTVYYQPTDTSKADVLLMNEIREIWVRCPFYGYRRIKAVLTLQGHRVNRKRVQRLMLLMGLRAIYPGPKTSVRNKSHAVYPYLLQDVAIVRPNQAWMVDITYLKMGRGFMYLVALIDVHSRYVVSWELSNTLHADFCVEALKSGLKLAMPDIVNSDQGTQFTCQDWIDVLIGNKIKISMTGKGRCIDNSVPRAQGRLI